ncbi:MAG: hypothetical protein L0332_13575 [Chloroflexi bacterium]|nr:hypothetical protein [Chloroflexota bacterium]MCI0727734.1 hypothetical protein [Chloroflexota bacterium]
MSSPDWSLQVKIKGGRSDTGAHHRAIDVARQLLAAGKWPDCLNTLIVIHDPYDLHRRLQQSGPGAYHPDQNVTVYPAVHELEAGRDYEITPMSESFKALHSL